MHMKMKLQEIHAQIAATIMPRDFVTIVLLELLPLLKEPGPLKAAYDARVHYYERLAKNEQYLVLIQAIHALLKDIHRFIDLSKFPKKDSKRVFFHPSVIKCVNAQEMHALLIQKEQWAYLGHKTVRGPKDSILCPWLAILGQYLKAISWIQYAIEVSAADESAVRPYLKHLRASYGKLKQMLADPFKRLHITEFEHFHVRTLDPEKLLADESPKAFFELRDAANQVCQDLLSVLDTVEAEEQSESPRIDTEAAAMMFPEWTGDQSISYDGKNLSIGEQKAKIPKEGDATIRQILLMKLVEDYNSEKSIGVDTVAFMQELRKVQVRPSMRALETAANALNDEVEAAFNLCKFVKASRSVARIIKSDKQTVQN